MKKRPPRRILGEAYDVPSPRLTCPGCSKKLSARFENCNEQGYATSGHRKYEDELWKKGQLFRRFVGWRHDGYFCSLGCAARFANERVTSSYPLRRHAWPTGTRTKEENPWHDFEPAPKLPEDHPVNVAEREREARAEAYRAAKREQGAFPKIRNV